MKLEFSKYHGAGNDFILIDNRDKNIALTKKDIAKLCHRRFGIGADGLMILELESNFDFRMVYYNSDGKEGSMCGNGGRCIAAFAYKLGLINTEANFIAIDGEHTASINSIINNDLDISLKMNDVKEISEDNGTYFLDTGSPHHIAFVDNVSEINVLEEGKEIRYSQKYAKTNGTNVNFVSQSENGLKIRTYERGVEDETLACGTGATAAAIAYAKKNKLFNKEIILQAIGGVLRLKFDNDSNTFSNIILSGPAQWVFDGTYEL